MKLGCLPYLNVKPLSHTLEHGALPAGWELVYAPPSKLAEMLADGEIAAAPVSSFATFANTELEICPEVCISADGPVKSVLMLSKVGIESIKTVALDTSSLSGANMLKILLSEIYHVIPEFVRRSPDPVSGMLADCDAALVIGNPAMLCAKDGLRVMDLAEEWRNLTGLPAVFAVWAGKHMTPDLIDVLQEAKRRGMAQVHDIARAEADALGLPFDLCDDYLSHVINYDLGAKEALGLKAFRDKVVAHGLIENEALPLRT